MAYSPTRQRRALFLSYIHQFQSCNLYDLNSQRNLSDRHTTHREGRTCTHQNPCKKFVTAHKERSGGVTGPSRTPHPSSLTDFHEFNCDKPNQMRNRGLLPSFNWPTRRYFQSTLARTLRLSGTRHSYCFNIQRTHRTQKNRHYSLHSRVRCS